MTRYRVLPLLLLVSSMMSQVIGMVPAEEVSSMPPLIEGTMPNEKKEIGEGIAQRIEELPKELQYKIFSSALALLENQKYEIYKKIDVGSNVTRIALNADNTRALTSSVDGIIRLWDIENRKLLKEFKRHKKSILSVALDADSCIALIGLIDRTVGVWNISTGELIKRIKVGSGVHSVELSADGALALTGSNRGIALLYNTTTGELLKELKGHTDTISSAALSADGKIALTGSYDGTARVWDTLSGGLLKTLQVGCDVTSVALSADGTSALIGTINKVLVWDVKSGALLDTLLTNNPPIYSVALSKDGKRALVGTAGNKIQVWNTKPLPGKKETSMPLTELKGHTEPITTIAFGGADFIASGSTFNTTALIWKPFALEPQDPLEREEALWQAYKETFSRPKFLLPYEK